MNIKLNKPVAVHLHLYYTDMWPELCVQLNNLGSTPYRLFVTLVKEDPELTGQIKKFCPSAQISVVKNMGYDIGPFIEFLNGINLDDYSYILKLHSKRPSNGTDTKLNHLPVTRYYWKVLLSQALIGSPEIWQKNLQAFADNPKLGMIGSPHLIKKLDKADALLFPQIQAEMSKLGLSPSLDFSFLAGTMFIVRSDLLKILQHHYTIEDFAVTDGTVKDGTLAHIMERLFGGIIAVQGYTLKGFHRNYRFVSGAIGKIILRFFYQRKRTKNNKILIKICRIPVYQKKTHNFI